MTFTRKEIKIAGLKVLNECVNQQKISHLSKRASFAMDVLNRLEHQLVLDRVDHKVLKP